VNVRELALRLSTPDIHVTLIQEHERRIRRHPHNIRVIQQHQRRWTHEDLSARVTVAYLRQQNAFAISRCDVYFPAYRPHPDRLQNEPSRRLTHRDFSHAGQLTHDIARKFHAATLAILRHHVRFRVGNLERTRPAIRLQRHLARFGSDIHQSVAQLDRL